MCAFFNRQNKYAVSYSDRRTGFCKKRKKGKKKEDITMDTTVEGNVFLLFYSYFWGADVQAKLREKK